MATRNYVLTKVRTGDYVLPGNDGRTLFRISRAEGEGWDLFQWQNGPITQWDRTEDPLGWNHWECIEQLLPTRQRAINEAVRLSTGGRRTT